MRYLIVGTAGHIDHGKSSLVRALTGTDPDRLKEEKERGITIDLGFADLALGDEATVSFVDVPGHERFVRHMVAGATGIDAVLLVVAADEGIRPQTREHVAICSLLRTRRGIVALTKADLVDAELREVVELEVGEFLQGSFLEGAPVIPVSSKTGEGLDALRSALAALFEAIPPREAGGVARLPVDRSFVLRGFGTVVTGTLASGALAEGEEIEILPGGRRGRIRGLQVHGHRIKSVAAGQRAAVNLQGLDRDEAPRGATIGHPGSLPVTRRVWAHVRLLDTAPAALLRGGVVRFHQGTCERWGRLRVLEAGRSGEHLVELRLRGDTVLLPGDPFILRRPAPVDTVGGGVVSDIRPPTSRSRASASVAGSAGDPRRSAVEKLRRAGAAGRATAEIGSELGLSVADVETLATTLESAAEIVRAGAQLFDAATWSALESSCLDELARFHAAEPLRKGMSREDLRSRVARGLPQEAWRVLVQRLAATGAVTLDADRVARAGHEVRWSDADRALADRIEGRFREAALDPPDPADVLSGEGGERAARIADLMVADGRLVRIRDGRLFHGGALAELRAKLRARARTAPRIDVADFKTLAGVTRKNAIPLLEQMDAERVTRRVGNEREILLREDGDTPAP